MSTVSLTVLSRPLELSTDYRLRSPDLSGLFGDDDLLSSADAEAPRETYYNTQAASNAFGGTPTSFTKILAATTTTSGTAASRTAHTYSIIGSPPEDTATNKRIANATQTFASATATLPTVSIGVTEQAPTTPPGEATEWKVIGVAVIAISFVATVILAIVFFDSWSSFIRDMILGKKKNDGLEKMVPDWEKRSWEFKLANEDGHRYPTLASLDSVKKEQPEKPQDLSLNTHSLLSTPLNASHLTEYYPHPLEPLVRRPSTRTPAFGDVPPY